MLNYHEKIIRRSFLKACAAVLPASVLAKLPAVQAADVIVSVCRGDRGILTDAFGNVIPKCIEANLTTGRCIVFKTQNGKLILNTRRDAAEREVIYHPSPMHFERKT